VIVSPAGGQGRRRFRVTEQLVLAEYCPEHFDKHVTGHSTTCSRQSSTCLPDAWTSTSVLRLSDCLPPGGIFLVNPACPEGADTTRLMQVANEQGVAVNPGASGRTIFQTAAPLPAALLCPPELTKKRRRASCSAEICRENRASAAATSNAGGDDAASSGLSCGNRKQAVPDETACLCEIAFEAN
jgi:hypothetical protein